MDPPTGITCRAAPRFPRTRGDGPYHRTIPTPARMFPPHARGWTRTAACGTRLCWFPPHARGWTLCSTCATVCEIGFPRTRGDGPCPGDVMVSTIMFPPHARGWTVDFNGGRREYRGFPRTRGDGPAISPSKPMPPSFPRTRGDGPGPSTLLPSFRKQDVSPARAGMDPCPCRILARIRGRFPRTRGDGPAGHEGEVQRCQWVSPARAGMDPTVTASSGLDEQSLFPPHARGWTLSR